MSNSPAPSPLVNRWLPTLLLILAALGVPAAAIGFFTHLVTTHPLLATIIGVLYEAGIIILGFMGKIWGKVESRWVDRGADWMDQWIIGFFSHYHKKYCAYLGYQHRDFDVKGLSLQGTYTMELGQVFIELSIDPTTLQEMSTNPIQIPKVLAEGSHSIWDYLSSEPLAKQHLVLVGPPGSGKTTLLKHITLTLLAHGKQRHQYSVRIPRKLPLLLFLRDHANTIHTSERKDAPDFTLVEALHDHLKKWEQPEPPVGWIQGQLRRGRCLVMLDGLDEVADPQIRKEVVNWVQRQMVAYKDNRFVITSRPFGFRTNPLSGVAVLQVRPFTSQQVERFVHKWYLADEIMRKQKDDLGVQMRARAEAKSLLQQLYDTPALLDLTVNPLLLTMITIVHRYGGGGKLPEKRVSLYEDICKVFLGKRQEARGQDLQLKPDQMQLVLQPLACYMIFKGLREITPSEAESVITEPLQLVHSKMPIKEFLTIVENVSGLLLERENGVYAFAHKTFQEYLTAVYIREKQLVQQLVTRVGDVWWEETIRLYCAMADATPIIKACLVGDSPSTSTLILALDCQREARELKPEVKAHIERILNHGMEDTDQERQHIVAEVILARRLSEMVRFRENTFVDTSLITCGEYQLFLDEQRKQGNYYQPDHWLSYRFSSSQGYAPLLGIRSSDATYFCTWLTNREAGPWLYRLPAKEELNSTEASAVLSRFADNTGFWLAGLREFAWVKESRLVPINAQQQMLALDLVRGLDLDLAISRGLDLAIDLDLVRSLDHGLDHGLARALALAFDRDFDHARARARNLDLVLDLDIAIATAINRGRVRDHDLDLARIRIRDLDLASALAHDHDLKFHFDFAHDHDFKLHSKTNRSSQPWWQRLLHIRDRLPQPVSLNVSLYIYLALSVVERRVLGKLSACEGILLIKERKNEQ